MLKRKLKLSQKGQPADPRAFTHFLDLMDNHPFQVIGMILMLGVVFSVIVMASHPPSLNSGETDSWWTIALNLKHGHGYSLCLTQYFPFCGPSNQVTAMREPVPVFLFAMATWLGGESLWTAAAVEGIIYLAIILCIYFLTRAWADTRSAVIASFLWVIYLPALELLPQVSGDLLAALCTTLGILFTLRARKIGVTRDWIFAGIGLGFAVLSRSATLVIPLFVVGGQAIESWRQNLKPKDILWPALVISALVILFMAPWLIRNRVALGRPILGSSLTGYNLYRHNYMIEKDHYVRYAGSDEAAQAIENLLSQHSDLRGNENEAQMDLIYRNEALKIIESHPGQYGLLSAYRMLPLWFDWKIAEAYGHPTNRYGYLIMTLQATLLILAIVGLQKRANVTWPLWGSILAISAAYMAVDARLLYVMPVMPLVISLSAVGVKKLLGKVFG